MFGVGRKYADVLFASEKDYFFIVYCKTLDLSNHSVENTSFKSYTEEKSDIHLIEASIERYCFEMDIRCNYLNVLRAHV